LSLESAISTDSTKAFKAARAGLTALNAFAGMSVTRLMPGVPTALASVLPILELPRCEREARQDSFAEDPPTINGDDLAGTYLVRDLSRDLEQDVDTALIGVARAAGYGLPVAESGEGFRTGATGGLGAGLGLAHRVAGLAVLHRVRASSGVRHDVVDVQRERALPPDEPPLPCRSGVGVGLGLGAVVDRAPGTAAQSAGRVGGLAEAADLSGDLHPCPDTRAAHGQYPVTAGTVSDRSSGRALRRACASTAFATRARSSAGPPSENVTPG
jgi:hypothetical protein